MRRLETQVVLRFWRSMSSSMLVLPGLLASVSLVLFDGDGEAKVWFRPSFGTRPSCQVALAHQPMTSSLMLSNFGFWLMKSRIQ